MRPSDYSNVYPFASIFQNSHNDDVALSIMRILEKRGNVFRKLSWEE